MKKPTDFQKFKDANDRLNSLNAELQKMVETHRELAKSCLLTVGDNNIDDMALNLLNGTPCIAGNGNT
ncbi:hypothetical protein JZU51_00505, partial [bacterium]|nr:hypothetical protein [bacterium]